MSADAAVFPAWSEADWRKAAEAALKGKSVESLASRTADGIRVEPLYAPTEGPDHYWARRDRGASRRGSTIPTGAKPTPRRLTIRSGT